MDQMNNVQIYENYERFLTENDHITTSANEIAKMLSDNSMYEVYIDSLCDGLSESATAVVKAVADRQRTYLLQEAFSNPASAFPFGWTVLSFPILVDIYAEPIISEVCNVFPTDSPVLSVPRVRIKSTTKSYDGTSEVSRIIPTNRELVRADTVNITITPSTTANVFTTAGISANDFKMNRRRFLMTSFDIEDSATTPATNITVDYVIQTDNRNQLNGVTTFQDSGGATVTARITGHVDFDSGNILTNIELTGGTPSNYTITGINFKCGFTPVNSMNGRTEVTIETEMMDLSIDVIDDFMLNLQQETIQDYKSIFKIDIARSISEAIKRQILLNKEHDLKFELEAVETDIAANGAKAVVDLQKYTRDGGSGDYAPAENVQVLRAVIARISAVMEQIRYNFQMYPSYMLAGRKTAAMLRTIQGFASQLIGARGQFGWNGGIAPFLQMKVLNSQVLPENKIYLSTKAPANALEKSTIVDFIYQPLYIISEITDGNQKNFVRSRTYVKLMRPEGLGIVEVQNLDDFIM